MSTGLKAVKGGKTTDEFETRTRIMRGIEYTIRELSVPEYKECLEQATREDGTTPFQDLLDQMVLRAVSPSPAARSKPMPYPIYRTLEDVVNTMHFRTVPEDKAAEGDESTDDESADDEDVAVPNS